MKTISVSVSESDYEAFREAAKTGKRSIAQLIRDAMAYYRAERLEARRPLTELPTLPGHQLVGELPTRHAVHEELFEGRARD